MTARSKIPRLTPREKAVVLGDNNPALTLCPPGAHIELIASADGARILAAIIPHTLPLKQIETLYALGGGVWSDCMGLVRLWGVWAVLADPAWAEEQLRNKTARPAGVKFFFLQ